MIAIRCFIMIACAVLAIGFLWFAGKVICLGLKEFFSQYGGKKTSKRKKTTCCP